MKNENVEKYFPQWMIDDLARSGLTENHARKFGWYYAEPNEITALMEKDMKGTDGYIIPFYDPVTSEPLKCPDGRPYVRVKLREPLPVDNSERPAKYLSPVGGGVQVFTFRKVYEYLLANPNAPAYLTEGEKKALCANIYSLPCIGLTGNWGWKKSNSECRDGVDELCPTLGECLKDRDVYVIWDSDASEGKERSKSFAISTRRLAAALQEIGATLFRVNLPSNDKDKVGLDDYLVGGHSREDLLAYIKEHAKKIIPPPRPRQSQAVRLQDVLLPKNGFEITLTDTARALGKLFGEQQLLYCRFPELGDAKIVRLESGNRLVELPPAQACSEFEHVAKLKSLTTDKEGDIIEIPVTCNESQAKRIVSARAFTDELPPIRLVSRCPVLIERNDCLTAVTGYDKNSGILAAGGTVPDLAVGDAKELLFDLISEFSFATESDRSRYLANLLTPALIMGQVGNFRAPMQYNEAELSQTGKGFAHKITTALYGDVPAVVNQDRDKRGVGGMREKFDSWLVDGRIFISFDNLTRNHEGVFDSEDLCSFMTEDVYMARALRTRVSLEPCRHIIMATTNGCTLSKDLMNRSCPVAFRKREGHNFRRYPEGDLLDHVRSNSSKYLGAVFAIVNEWHQAGKPRTDVTSHDSTFNSWAQTMDWIVQNLLGCSPLLDGYEAAKKRITSPDLMWLRDLVKAVKEQDRMGDWLIATELTEIAASEGIEISQKLGVIDAIDELEDKEVSSIRKQIGSKMARCFKYHSKTDRHDLVVIDSFQVERSQDHRESEYEYGKIKQLKSYRFSQIVKEPSADSLEPGPEPSRNQVEPSEPSVCNSGIFDSENVIGISVNSVVDNIGPLGSPGSLGALPGSEGLGKPLPDSRREVSKKTYADENGYVDFAEVAS